MAFLISVMKIVIRKMADWLVTADNEIRLETLESIFRKLYLLAERKMISFVF